MRTIKFVWKILYNKKYSHNSLYGGGVFPFWLYIKYFGKPVYKKSRKFGINVYFSLMASNILGSLAHINFFINKDILEAIFWFIVSLFIMSTFFWGMHKGMHKVNIPLK